MIRPITHLNLLLLAILITAFLSLVAPANSTGRNQHAPVRPVQRPEPTVAWSTKVVVTSYNSVPEQTDNTPFITANGTRVRDGIVAANFLPYGTKVRFPEMFDAKVFTVTDRMNERYPQRVDIWSPSQTYSKNFGVRYLTMEVLR